MAEENVLLVEPNARQNGILNALIDVQQCDKIDFSYVHPSVYILKNENVKGGTTISKAFIFNSKIKYIIVRYTQADAASLTLYLDTAYCSVYDCTAGTYVLGGNFAQNYTLIVDEDKKGFSYSYQWPASNTTKTLYTLFIVILEGDE